jgi:hypothetical protein
MCLKPSVDSTLGGVIFAPSGGDDNDATVRGYLDARDNMPGSRDRLHRRSHVALAKCGAATHVTASRYPWRSSSIGVPVPVVQQSHSLRHPEFRAALDLRAFQVGDPLVQFLLAGSFLRPLPEQSRGGDLQVTANNPMHSIIEGGAVEFGRGVEHRRKFEARVIADLRVILLAGFEKPYLLRFSVSHRPNHSLNARPSGSGLAVRFGSRPHCDQFPAPRQSTANRAARGVFFSHSSRPRSTISSRVTDIDCTNPPEVVLIQLKSDHSGSPFPRLGKRSAPMRAWTHVQNPFSRI